MKMVTSRRQTSDSLGSFTKLLASLSIVLVLLNHSVHAGYEHTCPRGRTMRNVGYCGSMLTDMVNLLCRVSRGGLKALVKRSVDFDSYKIPRGLEDISLTQKRAYSFLMQKRQTDEINRDPETQNIVCECCFHRCAPHEMGQYCGSNNKLIF